MSRGPNHIRISAIGSAGQNISGDPTRGAIGGVSTAGVSTGGVEAMATFGDLLCARRRLEGDVGFFTEPVRRAFLAFRICFAILFVARLSQIRHAKCDDETGHAVNAPATVYEATFSKSA